MLAMFLWEEFGLEGLVAKTWRAGERRLIMGSGAEPSGPRFEHTYHTYDIV